MAGSSASDCIVHDTCGHYYRCVDGCSPWSRDCCSQAVRQHGAGGAWKGLHDHLPRGARTPDHLSDLLRGSSAVSYVAKLFGYDGFVSIPSFLSGTVAVGLICGAYQAEIFRAAYLALSKGELEAATAIGMSGALRFRRIIVPQVLRLAIPALSNVWQLSLKDSALISVTGLAELLRMSQIAAGSTRQYFTFFIAGGAIYLLLTAFSDNIFARAEKRANRSMQPSRLTDA